MHLQKLGRLLRVNLCRPPNEENTINTRLDCVDEILNSETIYFSIISALKDIPNLDRVVSHLVTIDKQPLTEARFERELSIILYLKQALERFSILEKVNYHISTCETQENTF
jgi:DNA mismatch repair protein MSH4